MGFFNKAREAVLGLGKTLYNVATKAAPYAYAGIKTLFNNPGFIGQFGGLASGALGLAGQLATGNIPGAVATGTALGAMGQKTFNDVGKAFKKELGEAKKGKAKAKTALKMSGDELAKLREGIAALGNKRSRPQPNINE